MNIDGFKMQTRFIQLTIQDLQNLVVGYYFGPDLSSMPTFLIVHAYFLEQHRVHFVVWPFVAHSIELIGRQFVFVVVHAVFPMMQAAHL